jgi:hypothetical protein
VTKFLIRIRVEGLQFTSKGLRLEGFRVKGYELEGLSAMSLKSGV